MDNEVVNNAIISSTNKSSSKQLTTFNLFLHTQRHKSHLTQNEKLP